MTAGERSVKIRFTGESKDLDRAAKSAEKTVDKFGRNVTKSVGKVAAGIPDMFAGVIGSMPPMGNLVATAIVGGLAVALAPLLGAAIGTAILLAVGGGVLAAGIMAVAKEPKVTAAFEKLKDSLFDRDTAKIEAKIQAAQERFEKARFLGSERGMKSAKYDVEKAKKELEEALSFNKMNKSFKDMFKPFIDPLARAAKTFTEAFDKAKPSIERMALILAPVIDKLAPALAEFFERVLPGIEAAVKASSPLFDTLAEHLPKIGDAIAYFFMEISKNGDDANIFLEDMFNWIADTIRSVGWLIGKFLGMYTAIRNFVTGAKNKIGEWKDWTIQKGRDVVDWFKALPDRIGNAFSRLRSAIVSPFRDAFNSIVRFWNSTIGNLSFTIPGWVPGIGGNGWSAPRLSERASGGPVSAGRSYLVGERGPEVITMGSTNGRVVPNRELGRGGDIYELHVDLGNAVKQVIRFENRDLKRRANAMGARA